ncbi:CDG_1a_G0047720.mRNA.1.CDS.1 [Saccharomyces cerevisiae]|nr:CDG_1a_G0047720.mRNA.1.CDS.1 [Saccharomyces cerevisiae]CAI7452055.1 CDG_1a_G0047720.mRNA.1.CDS.1 [Saccharomyces cerevisiae]
MEMPLFLNESYIFHRLRMWSIVLWHSCVFVCAECGNAYYRGAEVPYKTLLRLRSFRFRSKRISEF